MYQWQNRIGLNYSQEITHYSGKHKQMTDMLSITQRVSCTVNTDWWCFYEHDVRTQKHGYVTSESQVGPAKSY